MNNTLKELTISILTLFFVAVLSLAFLSGFAYVLGAFTVWIFNINYDITFVDAVKGGLVLLLLKMIISSLSSKQC